MKIGTMLSCGAIACCLSVGTAVAQDGPPPGMPPLPPGVLAQINLGQAGLLGSFYSNEQWGTTQGRIGQSRSTIGAATAPGGSTTGYKDASTDAVLPFSVLKALPDGNSYLRFVATLAAPNGAPNQVQQNAFNPSASLQYMTFPSVDTMVSAGAFIERADVAIAGTGTLPGTIERNGFGIRGDVLHRFTDNWGVSARAEYSVGESDLQIPAIGYSHVQGDNRFYAQTELVGTFGADDIAFMPEGWVLRPILGANFQRNFIEATADSFGAVSSGVVGDTEDYGMVWGSLGVQQQAAPGQWALNASLGLEHEYINDLNAYVDESTYVVGSVGASMMTSDGHQVVLGYTRHQGLNGNRSNQTLLASFNVSF
ncbi:hypothetical protein [Pelagibacterium halotolerans]|uniref:hypothetical protein n=1 Tax=Pelagibacterium halotolerans TaxID=531813 RepID=UPI00384EB46C